MPVLHGTRIVARGCALVLLATGLVAAAAAADEDPTGAGHTFGTYEEMRGAVGALFQQGRYAEAAAILADAVPRYPDHVMANTYNLALMQASLGDTTGAVRALEEGHRRGIFYGIWSFDGPPWTEFRDVASFQRIVAQNAALIAEAQRQASLKLEIVLPPDHDPQRPYPLFIALHGGGENLAQFKPRWTSPRLRGEFVVAYVQSSQVAAMDGYHWQDDAVTRADLAAAYREVASQVAIDSRRVVMGGFSSGGYATLVTLLAGELPLQGFVILCPEVPADPDPQAVQALIRRPVRGTVLTTGRDGRQERQRRFAELLAASGQGIRFLVDPDAGHWYPDDLEQRIDDALAHIESRP